MCRPRQESLHHPHAFDTATRPLKHPDAPLTPFSMPQYRSAETAEADRLEAKGASESLTAQADVQRADRYTLCVVLFATQVPWRADNAW